MSVVAHPWGRHDRGPVGEEGLARLRELGLSGVEVDHQDHDRQARDELRGIARNLGLVATGSSDHHGAGKSGHDLGCNTTDPDSTPGCSSWPPQLRPARSAGLRRCWSRERGGQPRPAHRGLRDPVRDHGPAGHDPDLPVPHLGPLDPDDPACGLAGGRGVVLRDHAVRVLRPGDPELPAHLAAGTAGRRRPAAAPGRAGAADRQREGADRRAGRQRRPRPAGYAAAGRPRRHRGHHAVQQAGALDAGIRRGRPGRGRSCTSASGWRCGSRCGSSR